MRGVLFIYRKGAKILDVHFMPLRLLNPLNLLVLLGALAGLSGCGIKGGSPNAGNCTGNLVSGGGLVPVTGSLGTPSVASATVNLYDQGGGNYCINIAGINYSGPCQNAMIVQAQAGGNYYSAGSITLFNGTQNFFFSAATAASWVYFHCQSDPAGAAPNGMYARAQLL